MKTPLAFMFFLSCLGFAMSVNGQGTESNAKKPAEKEVPEDNDEKEDDDDDDEAGGLFAALLGYNFSGGNTGLGNFTPAIYYGYSATPITKKKFNWDISVNPYVAGQISIKDSSAYVPGLMLPGTAGIKIDNFLRFKTGDVTQLALMPACFSYKLITSFGDSVNILAQHNFRSGLAFQYDDLFMIGIQYTMAWHNSTSQSEVAFEKIFDTTVTDVQYLTVSLQTKLPSIKNSYLFAEWRNMMHNERLRDLPNGKIITLGVRVEMRFEHAGPAAGPGKPMRFVSGF